MELNSTGLKEFWDSLPEVTDNSPASAINRMRNNFDLILTRDTDARGKSLSGLGETLHSLRADFEIVADAVNLAQNDKIIVFVKSVHDPLTIKKADEAKKYDCDFSVNLGGKVHRFEMLVREGLREGRTLTRINASLVTALYE